MTTLKFTKMVATGNDFIVTRDNGANYKKIAKLLCGRKTGIGADGFLILAKSKKADFKMLIFNADGSKAEMCGNGLRCIALFAKSKKKQMTVETKAGIYKTTITAKNRIKIKMGDPKSLRRDINIKVNGRPLKVNYVDTGVPHTVVFVHGIEKIDVDSLGRDIRNNKKFQPRGTNVDFIEIIDDNNIMMRTYERGVEKETLACGTGAVAAAIITSVKCVVLSVKYRINVHTRGGVLRVNFKKAEDEIKDVYLEGDVREVYKGEVSYV